jgi:hypothetical protein
MLAYRCVSDARCMQKGLRNGIDGDGCYRVGVALANTWLTTVLLSFLVLARPTTSLLHSTQTPSAHHPHLRLQTTAGCSAVSSL